MPSQFGASGVVFGICGTTTTIAISFRGGAQNSTIVCRPRDSGGGQCKRAEVGGRLAGQRHQKVFHLARNSCLGGPPFDSATFRSIAAHSCVCVCRAVCAPPPPPIRWDNQVLRESSAASRPAMFHAADLRAGSLGTACRAGAKVQSSRGRERELASTDKQTSRCCLAGRPATS
jgi:hypothetical protein